MEPTEMVAARVRELRRKRGWTAQQLAEEMTTAGIAWNRGVVAKLENGRREGVSVKELLTLAWVFDVAPLVLLLPDDPEASVEITPAVAAQAERAYRWILGASPVPFDVDPEASAFKWGARTRRYREDRPTYMVKPLDEAPDLHHRIAKLEAQVSALSSSTKESEGDGDKTD